ncbi:Cytosolic 5'-nucleotidase 1A [Liparis tanakae]|uniref:Cytosolic 5'-nucleotidase 1A n=1 Tax=Liparis tanakae TaxID=230148 RepID=A0A4Z2GFU7_9TELE|nr:Cytosolic 5'-nucleotidase 1A [Liparis tanakae]
MMLRPGLYQLLGGLKLENKMSAMKPNVEAPTEDSGEEKDWAAAKAFFANLKTNKPRPVRVLPRTPSVTFQVSHSQPKPQYAVTIAVSSRTLFNMVAERKIYEEEGVEKYVAYQLEHEQEPLMPGAAFPFVKALMTVNSRLRELYPDSEELFDIVLMTNNHAQVGVRLINSINHHDLTIERFCMTGGRSPIGYLKAYMTNLYLSKDSEKVIEAIDEGCKPPHTDVYKRCVIQCSRGQLSDLMAGPLKCFLEALGKLQRKFYAKNERVTCPIRTYLVTARSAASSGARVLKTLRSWGLEIDEALFLAGAPKGPLLQKIKPHIYFDDQMFHIEGAKDLGTISAHVPYGIGQKYHKGTLIEKPATKE